ncbi:hypothetical protein Vretimale_12415 [Volvox reticuliferus]|uniref:Uncharacterized protein n=1 Tax=Volvox reticuliferus TaxID=1737510 RepID=A0A8J4GK91_9CHLO|nr:hypothetical protein Vretimale_12415 [Volvox reticuliferus]
MDVLLGLRVRVPASEWGLQEGAFWGIIVQLGIDTTGSSCVGIQFDGRDLFHWPTDMVLEWLADSMLMFKRPRLGAPDKTVLRPTASQRELTPPMGVETVSHHANEHDQGNSWKGIPPDGSRSSPPAVLHRIHTSNMCNVMAEAERGRDCSGTVEARGMTQEQTRWRQSKQTRDPGLQVRSCGGRPFSTLACEPALDLSDSGCMQSTYSIRERDHMPYIAAWYVGSG